MNNTETEIKFIGVDNIGGGFVWEVQKWAASLKKGPFN